MSDMYDGPPILRIGKVAFYSCMDKWTRELFELYRKAKDKELMEMWRKL